MVEQEVVRRIRVLAQAGWGHKRIAREVGVARNTVRRYVRAGSEADKQVRPKARRLTGQEQQRAVELWNGAAEGNAVVVKALLAQEGVEASVRTVQRAGEERRRQVHAAQVATVRFETKPGQQMQVDFGEKKVRLGGQLVKVFLLVAVLSFSRRLFVRAFLNQRGDDWRDSFAKPKLLVVDELGYLPFEKRSAHLFFQLVARRYEKGSLLLTTNQMVGQWGGVFSDDVLAAAILDRLLHHSHTLLIQGDSYRLRQKKKAGLLSRGVSQVTSIATEPER
jgi:hypothetical protein